MSANKTARGKQWFIGLLNGALVVVIMLLLAILWLAGWIGPHAGGLR